MTAGRFNSIYPRDARRAFNWTWGLLACFIKKPRSFYLSTLLGFSAGVMIYVSFVELLVTSIDEIGFIFANTAFLGGMGGIYIIDKFIPHFHIDGSIDGFHKRIRGRKRLLKAGTLTAVGLAIHNFPEGIAVFMVSLESISLGLPIAIAIAIHNIPEGVAVAVPIYHATRSRKKSSFYSLLSGITEPIGAIIGFLLLLPFLTHTIIHLAFAVVAGIMVFISFDELLPISMEYGDEHSCCGGLFAGMIVMIMILSVF